MSKNIKMPSSDAKNIIVFGFSIIFIVFVLIGGWSYLAPLATSSVAIGKVSADFDKKSVQHLEGGIVEKIFVKDGDIVKKGDILIQLEDKDIKAKIEQLQNRTEGLLSIINSKSLRLESIKEEIEEWKVLYAERLVDKMRIRELEREKDIIIGDIENAQFEIKQNERQIDIFYNALNRTKIIAPSDGVIVGLNIHTIGAVISASNTILEIVPQNNDLIVVAEVPITDIDKVHPGLYADVRFSAFNLKTAHVIEGEVVHVSADSFFDDVTGSYYYEAKIKVTSKGMKDLNAYGFKLVAGMPAEVMINIGERTLLSYFIKPFTDMLSRGLNEE